MDRKSSTLQTLTARLHQAIQQATDDFTAEIAEHRDQIIERKSNAIKVATIIRRRAKRDAFFPNGLFTDPAWDIILDLYIQGSMGRRVSISSACIAANVPASTGLGYIKRMRELGLIESIPDQLDGRRKFLNLTESARVSLEEYLSQID